MEDEAVGKKFDVRCMLTGLLKRDEGKKEKRKEGKKEKGKKEKRKKEEKKEEEGILTRYYAHALIKGFTFTDKKSSLNSRFLVVLFQKTRDQFNKILRKTFAFLGRRCFVFCPI